MKTKKILRFYFSADSLEKAFDNLIIHKACDRSTDGLAAVEALCSVIGDKIELERLWAYLDGILKAFSEEEREILLNYSSRGARRSDEKAIKRAVIRFTRRAHRLNEFEGSLETLKNYYCLLS